MLAKPWLAPEVTSENRLPMHSVPHTDRFGLDGKWRFQLLHAPDEALSATWSEADVPGCWTMQDTWDKPHYTNVQMPFPGLPPELPQPQPTGVYEREFDLKGAWLKGRRIVLHVGAAESVLIVSVNGRELGMGKDSHLASEFDVTEFVEPGTNAIRLRVVKWSDATYIEDQDEWWHGGITRSVYLYATPRIHFGDIRVNAGLADDLRTGTFELLADVDFDGLPRELGWTVEARLGDLPAMLGEVPFIGLGKKRVNRADSEPLTRHRFDLVAKLVSTGLSGEDKDEWDRLGPELKPPLDGRAAIKTSLPDVRAWSAEHPNLYPLHVTLRSPSGDVAEEADLRVGFRRVQIDGVRLLVNGKAVLLRGINRHDFDQHTGRVISPESIRADIVAMKQFGFNALRTSHYPNDPVLLDLTDELGMYVFEEADIESHAFIDQLCNDPRYLSQWVQRGARMVQRDKNHVSVIVWSLGNESGHGPNQDAEAGYIREYDPSRPLHYEGAIRWDWFSDQKVTDITCPMYPPISAIVAHAQTGRQKHPLIMCEYSHAMGNSNGTLAEYWDAIESTEGLQGGFIWEWWDHGLVQKLPDGTVRWAYGGDFGDEPNDGNFCLDGMNWPDRRPKPAMFEHRQIAAPVKVGASGTGAVAETSLRGGELEITNKQSFTGLEWLRATWELTAGGDVVAGGELPLPTVAPGVTESLRIPNWQEPALDGRELLLTVRFTTAAALPWAPAGFEVCWSQLALTAPMDGVAADRAAAGAGAAESAGAAGGSAVSLDAEGCFVHELLAASPRLSLWRAPTDNDRIMGNGHQWREWGLDRLSRRLLSVDRDGGATIVRANEVTGSGIEVLHEQRFHALPDGGVVVDEKVTLPDGISDVARVGIVLEAVPGLESIEWFGRGPVETYPDRRRAAPVARWKRTVGEEFVPYVRPQENGGHADVRWLELRDSSGRGFRVTTDRPRQASATHFRAADLASARHEVELTPRPETIVHVDAVHRGIGTASCGPDTLESYKIRPGVYEWSWSFKPVR